MIRGWNGMPIYRKMIVGLFGVGLIVFAFWTLSPLFFNRRVNEAFPAAVPASQVMAQATVVPAMADKATPTVMMADAAAMADKAVPTAVAAMADTGAMADQAAPTAAMADTGAMADQTAPTAAMADTGAMANTAPTAAMADNAAPAAPVALTAGMFIDGKTPGHHVDGTSTIFRLEDSKLLLRIEDFTATNGPDLFVVLSSSVNPDQDGVKNSTYIQLEALKGNIGNQNYELPADIELSQYKSVVIWCRTFNVVFGYAPLQSAS
jgi:hypothetical protein